MPPAPKKDCSVILFDLSAKCREKALQTLLKICCNNFFSDTKDLTKLILVNSETTENRLAADDDGYEHIHEIAKEIMPYNPQIMLEMIEGSGTGEANWLEALAVGLKNLSEEFADVGGIITLQLLFITDLATPLKDHDEAIVEKIIEDIDNMEAFVYIVGPDIEVPFTIKSADHVKLWMQNLKVDKSNKNLGVVKDIVTNTKNSVVCDFKLGLHLFFSYRNWGGTQPWQVPLDIGSKIQIPAQTMKILHEGLLCKLLSSQGDFGKMVWIDAEDESIEIDSADVKQGITRHEKFVQMPDNKMFQVQNTRSFSVLCFTDSANVPEYIMTAEGCYSVLPNGTPENIEAISILIDCLSKQNKYIIARRVYNNNSIPKIVVLIPKPDHNPKCFSLASLPYAEEIRYNYNEKSAQSAPKITVDDDVFSYLDSINVEDDKSLKRAPLGILMMQDSNCQKIINKAADKLLERHMKLEEIDIDYSAEPISGKAVDRLKNSWAERELKQVKKEEDNANDDNSDDEFDW